MLKVSEINEKIPAAVELFLDKFPNAEIPEIIVCTAPRKQAVTKKAYDECGLDYNDYQDNKNAAGEAIVGPLGKRVILYQYNIDSSNEMCFVLWHELGHIMLGSETQYGVFSKENTDMRSGFGLFSEFVAEYIAFTVAERTGLGIINADNLLERAFSQKRTVKSYWLSHYIAAIMGYDHLKSGFLPLNIPGINYENWCSIVEIKNMLEEQVKKEEFWKPSLQYIEELGNVFNDMASNVYYNSFDISKLIMDAMDNGGIIPPEYGIKNVNMQ